MARKSSVLNNIAMIPKQIKEKYGIEPIMKEMWVWGGEREGVHLLLVLYERIGSVAFRYVTCATDQGLDFWMNASETNPNNKEPKVGDKGYFWDNERYYVYDVIGSILETRGINDVCGFNSCFCGAFKHFSHDKQPWMK